MQYLSQLVPIEMRPCLEQEEKRRQYRKASARQVGVVEATQLLCDAAPGHQPDTDVDVAVPRWLLGARFTKSVLKAGNMVPNATPCERAIPM